MEEPKNLTLDRIIELFNAVEFIADNDTLDGKVSYWLGRLGDFCTAPVKIFNKERDKISKIISEKQEPLLKQLNILDKDKDKTKISDLTSEIQKLNEEFSDRLKKVLEQEESIQIPIFKLNQFVATEEVTRLDKVEETNEKGEKVTKKVEVKIRKGQSLVPVRFYKLMGEYIQE